MTRSVDLAMTLPPGAFAIPPRTGTRTDGWEGLDDILAIRLDAMGDVLMTTPAFRAIRASARGARLTLLTSSAGAAVARLVPELHEVIAWDPPWMPGAAAGPAADRAFVEALAARRFDAAIVFSVHTQSPLPAALLARLAGIPRVLAHARETPYGLVTDWVPEPEPGEATRHEVRRQLDLVGHVGFTTDDERLSLRVPPDAMRRLRDEVLPSIGIRPGDGQPWLVVHPGASAPSRRYRPDGYAAAVGRLVREDGVRAVFTGSTGEVPLVEEIRGAMGEPSLSLAGRLDLGELCALLAVAPLLIANNTGPVHVAAALGTPVVDLYALTNPQHTPWMTPSRVLNVDVPCAGCRRSVCPLGHQACLSLVHPERVVEAARELLAAFPVHGSSAGVAASTGPRTPARTVAA
ncbi:MAG TPA: glycosyltransferase family 9 protein [Candidatus Limnocylindrales bacterium]|nr:glycosyltransferase family 9 protein [Candidatus Limnocylindrales bacterium]